MLFSSIQGIFELRKGSNGRGLFDDVLARHERGLLVLDQAVGQNMTEVHVHSR